MSGIVLSESDMKDLKPISASTPGPDSSIKLSSSDMKNLRPIQTSTPPSRPWSQVPKEALKNTLPSLGKTAENIGSSLLHPLDSAESVIRGASGGLDLALRAMGAHPSHLYMNPDEYQKDISVAHALGSHLEGRYGSEEAIKKTLATDPAGALLDASAILSPASGLLKRAGMPGLGEVASKIVPQPVSGIVGKVGTIARKVGSLPGKGVAHTLARMTGTSAESIAESLKGKTGFVKQMRGGADAEETLANDALKRLSDMKQARSEQYGKDLAGLGNPELDTSPMVKHFVDRMKKERVAVDPKSLRLDFSNSSLGFDEGLSQIDAAHKLFRKAWQKKNIGMQDAIVLKHQVGNLLDTTKPGSRAHAVMIDLKKGIDNVLNQHPGFRKMNRTYAAQSHIIDQAEKAFSLKQAGRKNIQTILTKMQTQGRRHNQFARDLLSKVDPSGDLTAQMHGLEMKPAFRRGFGYGGILGEAGASGYGLAAHSATLPGIGLGVLAASSPRIVGEAGNLVGKGGRMVSSVGARSRLTSEQGLALLNELGMLQGGQQ